VECFPSDATVDVLNNGKVPLSSLKIGAQVRVLNEENQLSYSPIIAFLHRDLDEHALYKRVRTKNSVIELSQRHLIHQRKDGFIWAEKLNKGDEILVLSSKYENETQWEEIIDITDVYNVHASCYALVKSHKVAHFALAPYRFYHRLFGQSSKINSLTTPILSYAEILLHFFKNLPIAKDLIF
jgi:hypothetical protein